MGEGIIKLSFGTIIEKIGYYFEMNACHPNQLPSTPSDPMATELGFWSGLLV